MKKRGFTLVELLAVIVILAVILLVAIPRISKRLQSGKENAFIVLSKNVIRQLEYNDFDYGTAFLSEVELGNMNTSGFDLNESTAYVKNNEIHLNLVGRNEYSGMYLCGVTLSSVEPSIGSEACDRVEYVTVTFNPNGGTVSTNTKKVFYHDTYGDLPIPTRTGYTFKGWNGKNMLNYENLMEIASSRDINVNNGTISDSTPESDNRAWNYSKSNWQVYLNSGTYTLTLYFDQLSTNENVSALEVMNSNNEIIKKHVNGELYNLPTYSTTFNLSESNDVGVLVKAYDGAYKIQLEESSESTEWEPYYITNDTKVVQLGNHTLTAIWEAN